MSSEPKRGRGLLRKALNAEEARFRKLQYDQEQYYKLKTKPTIKSTKMSLQFRPYKLSITNDSHDVEDIQRRKKTTSCSCLSKRKMRDQSI